MVPKLSTFEVPVPLMQLTATAALIVALAVKVPVAVACAAARSDIVVAIRATRAVEARRRFIKTTPDNGNLNIQFDYTIQPQIAFV